MHTSAVRLPPIGFWSYSRQDDELSKGKLSNLRTSLMAEIQQQYGRDLVRLFQDVSTIPHGAEWEQEIRKSLFDATFFIPIITPNFIQSEWCSTEVRIFLDRERELCSLYADLPERSRIFPLHFIDISGVDPYDPDILAVLEQRQSFDFRALRHRSFEDERVQNSIADFAGSIRKALQIKLRPILPAVEQASQLADSVAAHQQEEELRVRQAAAQAELEKERRKAWEEVEQLRREAAELQASRRVDRPSESEREPSETATSGPVDGTFGVARSRQPYWRIATMIGLAALLIGAAVFYLTSTRSIGPDLARPADLENSDEREVVVSSSTDNQWERFKAQLKQTREPAPVVPVTVTAPVAVADQSEACARAYRAGGSGTPAQQAVNLQEFLRACPRGENRVDAQRRLAEIRGYRDAIQLVMRADRRAAFASSPGGVWNAVRSIDTTATPEEFRTAYRLHVDAWAIRARVEGEPEGPARQARLTQVDRQIMSSYEAAVAIAVRYGVSSR